MALPCPEPGTVWLLLLPPPHLPAVFLPGVTGPGSAFGAPSSLASSLHLWLWTVPHPQPFFSVSVTALACFSRFSCCSFSHLLPGEAGDHLVPPLLPSSESFLITVFTIVAPVISPWLSGLCGQLGAACWASDAGVTCPTGICGHFIFSKYQVKVFIFLSQPVPPMSPVSGNGSW